MFDIILFSRIVPRRVELMNLAGHFFELLAVKGFIDLAKATLAEKTQ
jgi:hypothetical protein